jgi:protein HOOK3
LGSNWALKANNLRKLLRNLETYYHEILHKTTDFDTLAASISSIARQQDKEAIAAFIEIITAAAVTCDEKGVYVGWIMNMSEGNVFHMKSIIQSSLSRVEDTGCDDGDDDGEGAENDSNGGLGTSRDSNDNSAGDQDGMGFASDDDDMDVNSGGGGDDDDDGSMQNMFRDAMAQFNNVTEGMDVAFDTNERQSSHSSMENIIKERDDLRTALAEAKRELTSHQSQSQRMVEDTESSQKKLRALAEDLQERLERRQTELGEVEDDLLKTKRMLEDAQGKVDDLTEKNASLADELDIANAKATQLRKAEATVVAYRKKLEGVGVMNQQMTDLEDQSAKYLGQIMDLEMETKKVPELQKGLEEAKREFIKVQKERDEATETINTKVGEISKLKSKLNASVTTKKMFEEELNELRSMQQTQSREEEADLDITGISLTSAKSVTEVREKAMRLEIENKNLKKQLGIDINAAIGTSMVSSSASNATVAALEVEIKELQAMIKKKEVSIKKLTTDKDRLEAYTKKTLAKFQEKYLVALQECKAKLKEKHDKIEQLEVRSATEKSNQKREEKLLSSAMYELGLSIMQQKLKER